MLELSNVSGFGGTRRDRLSSGPLVCITETDNFKILNLQVRSYFSLIKLVKEKEKNSSKCRCRFKQAGIFI